jgi:hypothetical protein
MEKASASNIRTSTAKCKLFGKKKKQIEENENRKRFEENENSFLFSTSINYMTRRYSTNV